MKANKNGLTVRRRVYDAELGECVDAPIEGNVSAPLPEGTPNLSRSDHWRHHESVGMACHPSQAKGFNEKAKKAGLSGVHYSPSGELHCSSKGQLRGELKNRGYHNRDDNS